MCYRKLALTLLLFLASTGSFSAEATATEVDELRQMLTAIKSDYESRIAELENRLDRAERAARKASSDADDALEIAEETAISASAGTSSASAFNPAIGLILIGRYADIGTGWETIPGFVPGGELGPGNSGFSLGESELNLNASVDAGFFGNLTLALEDDGGDTTAAVEEAWIQTTALPQGLSVLAGRYFSGIGYLNKFHRHADDFSDRPLPYQAFLGGQYIPDGVQLRWIAPTALLLELGTELNWGSNFPATGNNATSPDSWAFLADVGGDVGMSHSWQLGVSFLSTDVVNRGGVSIGAPPAELFTGDSDLTGIDFVWKWASNGNSTARSFKLQGEYFRRDERGSFAGLPYDGGQDGWYVQGVWQFRQGWRAGYRYDEVSAGNGPLFAGTILETPGRRSARNSLMIDWSPSEFSRLRMQFIDDRVQAGSDHQFIVQYLMSIGAHGGHEF